MIVGTLEAHLVLRQARSLKDKRRVISSLKERLRGEFNLAVAEVDDQDFPQQAVLGIAVIGSDRRVLESALDHIRNYLERNPEAELAYTDIEFF